jgi:Collagen triple helix repeat (20 copies)
MFRRIGARMTYANVAATLALVLAMGGSAVAATHYLITSTRQISPKVLRELSKAGPSGAPGAAGLNGTDGANGAPGANGVNGAPGTKGVPGPEGRRGAEGPEGREGPAGPEGGVGGEAAPLKHWRRTLKAGTSRAESAKLTLAEVKPFKIVGHCFVEGTKTYAETFLESSEAGSFVSESNESSGVEVETAGEELPATAEAATSETAGHAAAYSGPYQGLFSAGSRNGAAALTGAASEGVFLSGEPEPACSFSGYVVAE